MRAQNELTPYFAEIEQRTERALQGIREVRRAPKLNALPAEPKVAVFGSAFLLALATFVTLFLD
ncbi:hypothetical protein FMN50_02225 [Rhodobacterales bacterium]|nr:hypothetical protein FMN50_02225 [Rhodobacterales bacterium]